MQAMFRDYTSRTHAPTLRHKVYGTIINVVYKVILDTETSITKIILFFLIIIIVKKTLQIHKGCGGGWESLNPLPLLPLKMRYVADLLPFCGFSAGNRLLCGAIVAGTSWRK
jgi:hypothetical protein